MITDQMLLDYVRKNEQPRSEDMAFDFGEDWMEIECKLNEMEDRLLVLEMPDYYGYFYWIEYDQKTHARRGDKPSFNPVSRRYAYYEPAFRRPHLEVVR